MLKKGYLFLFLSAFTLTLATVTQLASIGEAVTTDRQIFIQVNILLALVFSLLFIIFKSNNQKQ